MGECKHLNTEDPQTWRCEKLGLVPCRNMPSFEDCVHYQRARAEAWEKLAARLVWALGVYRAFELDAGSQAVVDSIIAEFEALRKEA